ncbi:MAG: T9SS type A sorting domain-containing protein [Bacteroidetes bacterium]|nr:T9SS type A sorting domain-containing protein [Bacteroidota bacterium]MBL7102938.1 T9SS type A sorting domain-containing protein [Bacteroidales bacterium]
MNKKIFFSILIIAAINITSIAQVTNRCSHKVSFEKSAISDTLDALHYYINLTVTDFSGHEIEGFTEVEMTTKVDNTGEIKLELMDLTVDSVFIDDIVNPSFTHVNDIITIPLSDPINIGEIVMVRVHYHGVPFHESWGGFHWSGEYAFNLGVGFVSIPHNLGKTWFPCIDDFQDRAYYDVYGTVEDNHMAVCGGLLMEIIDNNNGTKTYHWKLNQTIPTYLASIAVGDYAAVTDVYNGINDDIPIEIYVRPQDSIKVPGSFLHLKEILAIFEDKFGPYRWDRIGYVGTAIGAMEHVTNVAYPNFCINNTTSYESLYAHELSHMWFGDNVTCSSAGEMWINEGWAVFCEAVFREFLYNKDQYNEFIRDKHAEVLQYCHTPSGDGSYFPLNQIPQNVTYGMSAYDKGATVAHTLKGYLGDEIFYNAMAEFNEYFKYNYASSYDMRDFLTSHTGIDMSDFFESWVLTSGTPHFSVDSFSVVPTTKGADVTVYMRQRRKGSDYIGNSNIVELTFMDNSWNQFTDTIHFDGVTGCSVIEVPFEPDIVLCDFDEKLCDAVTGYAQVVKETGDVNFPKTYFGLEVQEIGDSAFVWVEHNWVPPDSLKLPVQGLTISDYRYWKIDGLFPDGFVATGKFWYNKNGYLDNNILTNPDDSVIILYRENPSEDWEYIDFTQIGIWSIGNLYIDNLQKGEYSIAVCDNTFVGLNKNKAQKNTGLKIYPNPSKNYFQIQTGQSGTLKFYDINGKVIDTIEISQNQKQVKWKPAGLSEGTYFVRLLSPEKKTLAVEKIILISK